MFEWLTRRWRMVGGLYFGPPGWLPERLLDARMEGDSEAERGAGGAREVPDSREGFGKLLEQIGRGRTSGVTPGVLEQVEELVKRDIRVIVLNLLPPQPEFAIGAGLTRLVM